MPDDAEKVKEEILNEHPEMPTNSAHPLSINPRTPDEVARHNQMAGVGAHPDYYTRLQAQHLKTPPDSQTQGVVPDHPGTWQNPDVLPEEDYNKDLGPIRVPDSVTPKPELQPGYKGDTQMPTQPGPEENPVTGDSQDNTNTQAQVEKIKRDYQRKLEQNENDKMMQDLLNKEDKQEDDGMPDPVVG